MKMKPVLTAGKTNHCGRCHTKRMFWLKDDNLYHCELCDMPLLPAEKVKPVTEACFAAYKWELDNGRDKETAVKAGREAWQRELDAADFDEDEQAMFLYGTGRM